MKAFFVYFFGQGTTPEFALFTPAHFAPILFMLAVIALIHRFRKQIRRSRHEETLRYILAFALIICDMSYYWRLVGMPSLLSGSLFALITPTPLTYTGVTRFRYYQFWLEHTLGYVAIFYMIFVHGMRPTVRSAVRSYIALWAMAALAYWVNQMISGANYLYMARPEAAPSVLDILPANFALRTAIIAAVITAMYGLAYLPWALRDRKNRELK